MADQRNDLPAAPAVSFYEVVRAKSFVLVGLGLATGLCFILLEYLRPTQDNKVLVAVISSIFTALLAYLKGEQGHIITNFRMTQWMDAAEKIAEARGFEKATVAMRQRELEDAEKTIAREKQDVRERADEAAEVLRVAAIKAAVLAPTTMAPEDLQIVSTAVAQAVIAAVKEQPLTPVESNAPLTLPASVLLTDAEPKK